jgi:hypothetical protein
MEIRIHVDEADLEPNETFTFRLFGIESWTSILVRGNGTVTLREQDREVVSVNLVQLAKQLGREK